MCRYLLRKIYWFYNYEVGVGPTTIIANIANTVNASGDITSSVYTCNFDGVLGACSTNSEVTADLSPTAATFRQPRVIHDPFASHRRD